MSLSSIYIRASLTYLSKGKIKEAFLILKYLIKVQIGLDIYLNEIDIITELLKQLE